MNPGDQSVGQHSIFGTIEYELDPDLNIQHPLLRDGLKVWNDLRGDRPMPAPADIDPLKLPVRLLPNIMLLDIEYQPRRRYRWRLIGTYITETLGRDSTGRYWDEIYDSRAMHELCQGPTWVIENRRPLRNLGTAHFVNKTYLKIESVDMPLSTDGEQIDRLFVCTAFGTQDTP